jgi:crotonobetainyl-CoA:carnitine CoA-transferase CaiB-like acyl-CoA transferase
MDALEGLTVLDFTSHIAGPYATKLMADLGARVIKVERPGGDIARSRGPWLADEPGLERSGTYQFLNTNKESVVLDLKRPEAKPVVDALVRMADLVVVAFPPETRDSIGLGYERLSAVKDVPVVEITNFGDSGPYRDYRLSETVLYAMGAEMFSHGTADREPLKLGATAALVQSGAMAAVAALGAVYGYEAHGTGQRVQVPLFEVQINNVDRRSSAILGFRFTGRINSRPAGPGGGLVAGVHPCADGYVEITAAGGEYWKRFTEMLGEPALQEPRWLVPGVAANPDVRAELDGIVYPWLLSRTRLEIWAEARRARALVAPLFTSIDLVNDPVFRERGLWTEVEHAVLGRFPMLARPYILEKTPWRIRNAAPTLGEHTRIILAEAGFASTEIEALITAGVAA